jgi:hypothetical protein
MTGRNDNGERVGRLASALTACVSLIREWGIALLGAAVIAPFVALCFFNQPAADDFDYARQTLTRGFWGAQSAWYRWWTGRFVNSAIMSVNPLVVRWYGGFKVLPLLLLMLLAASMYFFVRELSRPEWSLRRALQAATVLLVLYLEGMPSIREGLYWYSSASTYQIPNAFSLILVGLMVRRYRNRDAGPGWRLTLAAVLSILIIGGSNETSSLILLFLLSVFVVGRAMFDRRLDRWATLLLAVAVLVAGVMVAAPGNAARMAYESGGHHHHAFFAAAVHSLDAIRQVPDWTQSLAIPLFGLLLVPIAAGLSRRNGALSPVFQIHPLALTGILFAIMVLCYFPTYWSVEHGPLPRTLNVAYLLFLIGFFVIIISAIRYSPDGNAFQLPGYAILFVALCIALSLKAENGNTRRAWADLISGRAHGFDVELRQRYERLAACDLAVCEVEPIVHRPVTLFEAEVARSEKANEAFAEYFGKKAVRLKAAR